MYSTPFSTQLRTHRLAACTQKELSEKSGYSVTYLSKMENGLCAPTKPDVPSRLAEALNLAPVEKEALILAARDSQRVLKLPESTSLIGYRVAHHLLRKVSFLDDQTLMNIDRLITQAIPDRKEASCP